MRQKYKGPANRWHGRGCLGKRPPYHTFEAVKTQAYGQWDWILQTLGPSLHFALERKPRHVPCPHHGGRDGFRLFRDGSGGGVCNTCGHYPDGFALLAWVNGWSLKDTLAQVADVLGIQRPSIRLAPSVIIPQHTPKEAQDTGIRLAILKHLWSDTLHILDPLAEPLRRYIANRGIGEALYNWPSTLRFHPALDYWQGKQNLGKYPAMIARIQDLSGHGVTLHRTYLTQEGYKASLDPVKKLMPTVGVVSGAAIRLDAAGESLALCEGIETGLALRIALKMPVWSCVAAGGLAKIQLPEHVKNVFIMADADPAGMNAAQEAGERLSKSKTVRIVVPEQNGCDWLDVFNEGQNV